MKNCFVESCLILICSIFSSPPYIALRARNDTMENIASELFGSASDVCHKLLVLKYQPIPNPQSNS